jgi:[ribosomal protein S18]-alanine N-acetyltransferase
MTIQIESAALEDAEAIAILHEKEMPPGWTAAGIAMSLGNANRIVLKAHDGGAIEGFVILQFAADEAEILTLAVAEERRRQGAASLLLEAILSACEEKSVSSIYLEVAEGNEPAVQLYRKFGFKIIASRKNYYQLARSVPEAALIMRLDSAPGVKQIASPRAGRG